MADEIMETIQIIRFGYDGVKMAVDVTGASIEKATELVMFICGLLHNEKVQGKTSLKKMLKTSGDLQVLQISEKDVKQFHKLAKKYGILYSKMPDINKGDGMKEFIFPAEAVPRVRALMEKLEQARLEDITDYVKNGDGNYEKVMEYLRENNLIPENVDITPERAEELKEVVNNIRVSEGAQDITKVDITLSENLIKENRPDSIITRVPGTFGENVRYLQINRDDIMTINHGKTLLTFLNKDQEYELLDKDGNVAKKIKGEELRENHYDRVGEDVRERAMKKKQKEQSEKKLKEKMRQDEKKNKSQRPKQKSR